MRRQQCLFYNESNRCNDDFKEEHIIQNGLGGTLSSPDIICGACNDFFSRELDPQLTKHYFKILHHLSPLLSGDLKRKKSKEDSIDGPTPLEVLAGGVTRLSKIEKKYDKNGKLCKILAPMSTSREELERIREKEVAKGSSFRFDRVPVSEEFNGLPRTLISVEDRTIRAVALNVLELIRHGTITRGFPDIARHNCLKELRRWVRQGGPPLLHKVPYAPISDMLDPLFEPSTFSHRLVASYDHGSKSLSLVAQFVNMMPWLIVVEDVNIHPSSVSILYKKALIGGRDEYLIKEYAVLDVKAVSWRKFSYATREANEFHKIKYIQEYSKQYGKAAYVLDMCSDKEINQTISDYINFSKVSNPELEAIVQVMENRYQRSPDRDNILKLTHQKALSMLSKSKSSGRPQDVLKIYRVCLKDIVKNYGYPEVIWMENEVKPH